MTTTGGDRNGVPTCNTTLQVEAPSSSLSASFAPAIPMRASLRRRGDSEHRSIHGDGASESDGIERVADHHPGDDAQEELGPSSRRGSAMAAHSVNGDDNSARNSRTTDPRHDRPPSSTLRTSHQSLSGQKGVKGRCYANDDCLRVYAIIPRIFSVIAFALSLTVLLDCRLIRLQITFAATANSSSGANNEAFGAGATLYFGLYQYASPIKLALENGTSFLVSDLYHQKPSWSDLTGNFTQNFTVAPADASCVRYPSDGSYDLTSDQRAARAFAILACVLGGMMMFLLWFKCCCGFLCSYLCPDILVSLILLVLLPAVQGLAMVFDDQVCHFQALGLEEAIQGADWIVQINERECGVDRRGLYYPFSIVLWLVCGVLFTCIKPRREDDLPYFQG